MLLFLRPRILNVVEVINILNKRNIKVVKLLPAFADRWLSELEGPTALLGLSRRLQQGIELRRAIRIDEPADVPSLADVRLVLDLLLFRLLFRLVCFVFFCFAIVKSDG